MVSTKVLFDTNILIDYLSGVPKARTELARCRDRAISVITWMEVMAGTTPADEAQVRAFLLTFRTVPITSEVAERSFQQRRKKSLKLPDAIILATAEVENRILVTRNSRDFVPGDPGIRIPYRI